jgi:hypothetical protein
MLTRFWDSRALIVTAGLILLGSAQAVAQPQSLGDVARREAERRKEAARAPGRSYTNDDLASVEPSATPLPPVQPDAALPAQGPNDATVETANLGPTVMEEDPVTHTINVRTTAPAREKRDEPYWRARAKDVRDRLAKASADLDAAQSSLSALDSGPSTAATARERAVVAAAVQRLQSDVRYRQLEVTKMQMHAEMKKVPGDWINQADGSAP